MKFYHGDCRDGLEKLKSNSINLTVTSPPYDDLREYEESLEWNKEVWEKVIEELYRVTVEGGVVVWIVNDATIDGSETLTSCYQKIHFKEVGFNIHDTMIYEKNSSAFPAKKESNRYTQIFEYMFIMSKGIPNCDLLCDKKNIWAGHTNWGQRTQYDKQGNLNKAGKQKLIPDFSIRNNIWKYSTGFNNKTIHPAVFPYRLARDHILSWSNPGDLVLDPFMGKGTVGVECKKYNRDFIGMEKVLKYYNLSKKLIRRTTIGFDFEK